MQDTIVEQQNLPLINVVVAVIQREDGHVLMAERPYGKESAGFWEFPGGKFELGESAEQAIARELYEELGIKSKVTYPWIRYKYTYQDKHVKLHVFRVFTWEGIPFGREGQRISWEDPDAIKVFPLLPANNNILEAIELPLLYVITNIGQSRMVKFMEGLVKVFEQGVRLIQVRTSHMSHEQLTQIMRPIVNLAHHYGAKVMIIGNESIMLKSGADGIHLHAKQLVNMRTRPCKQLLSVSCHNTSELASAAALRADFVLLSPVFSTSMHPNIHGIDWEKFSDLVSDMPMPVYVLGGLDLDHLETAMRHSAHGIALESNI